MPEPTFYVYELMDPRTAKPFYVGKGKGNRVHQHAQDAQRGEVGPRYERIREIVAAGHRVEHRIVRRFTDEERAYQFEAKHIARIGLANLTNMAPGGRAGGMADPQETADRNLAKSLLKIAYKTKGFARRTNFLFGGKKQPISACALLSFFNQFNKLYRKRGADWFAAAVR